MNQILWENLVNMISQNIGFHIKPKDYQSLETKLKNRIEILNLSNLEEYFNLLKDGINTNSESISPSRIYKSNQEWNTLASIITNGESFFFRDRGQFNLLEKNIIPELITQKRNTYDLNLKIWSSGCSTGQEPYSLAILLNKVIPDISQWNIKVIGTDINQEFLNKAKAGIYQNWSFRLIDPSFKRDYFTSQESGWQINNQIKNMVKFCQDNIVKDRVIPVSCYGADLILCRNVFIYFKPSSVAKGITKFYNALNPGGYLMTGHAELQGITLDDFKVLSFEESIIYQKNETSTIDNSQIDRKTMTTKLEEPNNLDSFDLNLDTSKWENLINNINNLFPESHNQGLDSHLDTTLSELEELLKVGQYSEVIKQGEKILLTSPHKHIIYYIIAQAYFHQKDIKEAELYSQKSLDIDSIFIPSLYLLAQIADFQNNFKKAKELLKRIIYLESSSIMAYLELGSIYTSEGDITRASKMYQTAYEILQDLPANNKFDYQGVTTYQKITTVSQLLNHLEGKLANLGN